RWRYSCGRTARNNMVWTSAGMRGPGGKAIPAVIRAAGNARQDPRPRRERAVDGKFPLPFRVVAANTTTMTRHVERIDKATGADVLIVMGLVGVFTFLPMLLVVVIGAVRHGVTHRWREIVIVLGSGLVLPTVFAVAALLGNRDGDREQISLIIDE